MPPDHYLKLEPTATAKTAMDPRVAVWLAVIVPIAIALLGYALLRSVVIDNSTGFAISYADVRKAIADVIDRDLAIERLDQILDDLKDPTPGSDDTARDARKTERATRLTVITTRLNDERGRFGDRLTALALQPHPGLEQTVVEAEDGRGRRRRMAAIVEGRFVDTAIKKTARTWVGEALDAQARLSITNAVANDGETPAATVVANAVADSVTVAALRRSAVDAVSPPYDPFDARLAESAWASDVGARLLWVVAALVFALTFGLVAFANMAQIRRIHTDSRARFTTVAVVTAIAAGAAAMWMFRPTPPVSPLHVAFTTYANLFRMAIVEWTNFFHFLRGAGIVLLVAGSVATFSVKVAKVEELKVLLGGFKALFNAGTVFLLAGTIEIYAGLRWPTLFADEMTRTALQGAAAAFATTTGAAFSVVLLATYFATTVVLRQQAIANQVDETAVGDAFKEFGFSDLTADQTLRFAQALAPLLPGLTTALLS